MSILFFKKSLKKIILALELIKIKFFLSNFYKNNKNFLTFFQKLEIKYVNCLKCNSFLKKSMEKFEIIDLPSFKNENGMLIPMEFKDHIPFEVKRSYFLKNIPFDKTRGGHSHFIEKEVFLCAQGSCVIKLDADGKGMKKYFLNSPQRAMFVDINVWHEFEKFSPDAVLLAFSSTNYLPGEKNYLENYEKFCEMFKTD